mmetsp:Transcript_4167/g.8200  ORF Transcript_4167/g.8200 Transcript_4167/m.8200 type:complete len:329 (+) Transcript_4167:70-1056(+)
MRGAAREGAREVCRWMGSPSRSIYSSTTSSFCLPADYSRNHTLANDVRLFGFGLHNGKETRVTVRPFDKHGVYFYRRPPLRVGDEGASTWRSTSMVAVPSPLCTTLRFPNSDDTVSTVEHLASALAGVGITSALVEVDGGEVPVLDGSALPFVEAFVETGIEEVDCARDSVRGSGDVCRREGQSAVELGYDERRKFPSISASISFSEPIGNQQYSIAKLTPAKYVEEIALARTFTLKSAVDGAKKSGLIKGGNLDNAIVYDDEKGRVLNTDGLRYADEAVRHKLLDMVGDVYLRVPLPFHCLRMQSTRGGHRLNIQAADEMRTRIGQE